MSGHNLLDEDECDTTHQQAEEGHCTANVCHPPQNGRMDISQLKQTIQYNTLNYCYKKIQWTFLHMKSRLQTKLLTNIEKNIANKYLQAMCLVFLHQCYKHHN